MQQKVLDEINADSFKPKQFHSNSSSGSNNKKTADTIVIDLAKQTIKVADIEPSAPDSIFHSNVSVSALDIILFDII